MAGVARQGGRVYWFLAAGFAVLAALLTYATLQGSGATSGDGGGTIARVVAAQQIPARTRIEASMLRVEQVPASSAVGSGFATSEPVVGLITRYPVAQREQLSAEKVGAAQVRSGGPDEALSFVVPRGQRAIAIEVTEQSAVGGLVVPGDRVDVIALFDDDLTRVESAVTVLQNVEVLAVAQEAQRPVPPSLTDAKDGTEAQSSLGVRPTETKAQPAARTVTLAVGPNDAQLVALAGEHGTLWLTLRGFEDLDTVELATSDLIPLGALSAGQR